MLRQVAWVLIVTAGCASPTGPKPDTRVAAAPIAVAGDRCHDGKCTCRVVDEFNRGGLSDEQDVAPGQKRFELRTGRGFDDVSITVEGRGTVTKSRELPEAACAYIDLPPGKHHVRFHARAAEEAGMVPSLFINEWSQRTHDWYETFQFRCGGGDSTCTKDMMTQWADTDGKRPRGIFDPCGSTRVESLRWDVAHSADVKVQELELDFVLEVYKFVPRFPHGAKTCKGVGGVDVEDAPKDLPQ